MSAPIKIIIAEHHEIFRKKLVENLKKHNIETVGEASNGFELLELFKTIKPDVLLMDLPMPLMDGNKAFTELLKSYPDTKVIILSYYCDDILMNDYFKRGAKGYLPKEKAHDHVVVEAIVKVNRGGIFVVRHKGPHSNENHCYTRKQVELIPLLCKGFTNKEIAVQNGISERSVEKRRQLIYLKLGIEKAVNFYKYAFTSGMQYLNVLQKIN